MSINSRSRSRRKKTAVMIVLLLAAAAAMAAFYVLKGRTAPQGAEASEPETVTVERMDLTQSLTLSGTVKSGATYSVTSPLTDVEIRTIEVKEGDRVRKGDVIATLDSTQLRAGRKAAQQNVSNTRKRNSMDIAAAERSYKNAKQDRRIHAGRSRKEVEYARRERDEAEAERTSLASQHAEAVSAVNTLKASHAAENDEDRKAELGSELEKAQDREERLAADLKTAEENVKAARQSLEKARQDREDDSLAQSRNVAEQKAALRSARLAAGESLSAPREEVRKADRDLKDCTVVSEIDGVVTSVAAKPGDMYKGDAIAVINDDSSYRVSASVDQYDISSLADGQEAEITVRAADMEDAPGSLIHVAKTPVVSSEGEASGQNGAEYLVEASIKEPGMKLRIGMTAKVVVKVWEKKDCLAVPDNCIQTDENGERYVETVDKKGGTKQLPVKYGMKTDYYSEISGEGVEEGMSVIVPVPDEFDAGDEEGMY